MAKKSSLNVNTRPRVNCQRSLQILLGKHQYCSNNVVGQKSKQVPLETFTTIDIPIRDQGGHKEKDILDWYLGLLIPTTVEILFKKNNAWDHLAG